MQFDRRIWWTHKRTLRNLQKFVISSGYAQGLYYKSFAPTETEWFLWIECCTRMTKCVCIRNARKMDPLDSECAHHPKFVMSPQTRLSDESRSNRLNTLDWTEHTSSGHRLRPSYRHLTIFRIESDTHSVSHTPFSVADRMANSWRTHEGLI